MPSDRIDDALSRGFDAGNYANAYTSADDLEWARAKDRSRLKFTATEEGLNAFEAAFTIGFFSSYETHEVPEEHVDDLLDAEARYGPRMRASGINVAPRHSFVPPDDVDDHAQVLVDVGVSWMRPRADRDFCAHRGLSGHRDCGMPREDHGIEEDEEDC